VQPKRKIRFADFSALLSNVNTKINLDTLISLGFSLFIQPLTKIPDRLGKLK
jgi:hypothetical protein